MHLRKKYEKKLEKYYKDLKLAVELFPLYGRESLSIYKK